MERKLHVIAAHGCRGTFHFENNTTFIVPENTLIINFNNYGTESSAKDSLIFMQRLCEVNEELFNYIINPNNYLINLDRNDTNSYRHPNFFQNPLHKLYSEYNPIANIDIYLSGMEYYDGHLNLSNREGAAELHGVYEFNTPVVRRFLRPTNREGTLGVLRNEILELHTRNSENFNIIFVFSCRLVELRIRNIFDIMPHINILRDFNNTPITEYFRNDKLTKIFHIVKKDINEIYNEDDISFNIGEINLALNNSETQIEWIRIVIEELRSNIHNINDMNEYIKYIFNNYNAFECLYRNTYEQFTINLRYPKPLRITSYEELILLLCQCYVNPVIRIFNDIININQQILTRQQEIISAYITAIQYVPQFYQYNLCSSLYFILNLQNMYISTSETRINFQSLNNNFIITKSYEYFKKFKHNPQINYSNLTSTIIDTRISFNFWCFYHIISLLRIYNIRHNYDELFDRFFRNVTFDENVLINNNTNTTDFFNQYRNALNRKHENGFFQEVIRLFENAEITTEPAGKRQRFGGYKEKYLKYKIKYLKLKNNII